MAQATDEGTALAVLKRRIAEAVPANVARFFSETHLCMTRPEVSEGWDEELQKAVAASLVQTKPTLEFTAVMCTGATPQPPIREHVWEALFGRFHAQHSDITEKLTQNVGEFQEFCLLTPSLDVFRHILAKCPEEVLTGCGGGPPGLHIIAMAELSGREVLIQEYLKCCPEAAKVRSPQGECAFLNYISTVVPDSPALRLTLEAFLEHTPVEWIAHIDMWRNAQWNSPAFFAMLERYPDIAGSPAVLEALIDMERSVPAVHAEALVAAVSEECLLTKFEDGWNACHRAAEVGSPFLMPLLRRCPRLAADLAPDVGTVLFMAVEAHADLDDEEFQELVDATPRELLARAEREQCTVLHCAADWGRESVARMLWQAMEPSEQQSRDSKGLTAAQVAAEGGHDALALALQAAPQSATTTPTIAP